MFWHVQIRLFEFQNCWDSYTVREVNFQIKDQVWQMTVTELRLFKYTTNLHDQFKLGMGSLSVASGRI
jgi:hypothetical protein